MFQIEIFRGLLFVIRSEVRWEFFLINEPKNRKVDYYLLIDYLFDFKMYAIVSNLWILVMYNWKYFAIGAIQNRKEELNDVLFLDSPEFEFSMDLNLDWSTLIRSREWIMIITDQNFVNLIINCLLQM